MAYEWDTPEYRKKVAAKAKEIDKKDKLAAKAYRASKKKKSIDPIAHAHRMSKDSSNSMYKKSMAHLDSLVKKKK